MPAALSGFYEPAPALAMILNKRWGVALIELPRSIDDYLNGASRLARRRIKHAKECGYTFTRIDPHGRIDEILAVNRSASDRQGRPMHPHYFDEETVEVFHPLSQRVRRRRCRGRGSGIHLRAGLRRGGVHRAVVRPRQCARAGRDVPIDLGVVDCLIGVRGDHADPDLAHVRHVPRSLARHAPLQARHRLSGIQGLLVLARLAAAIGPPCAPRSDGRPTTTRITLATRPQGRMQALSTASRPSHPAVATRFDRRD